MIKGFDMLLSKKPTRESLVAALADAYGIRIDDVNLQYEDTFDTSAPKRKLFCLVNVDDGEFPVLLTLDLFESPLDENIVDVASRITNKLACSSLIPSGSPYDDDTRLLISPFKHPKLVIVDETYDETHQRMNYKIEDY